MGARMLLPTSRRGMALGVWGLPEPGGRVGAGGKERELEVWGAGGRMGRAGAGRLAVGEGNGSQGTQEWALYATGRQKGTSYLGVPIPHMGLAHLLQEVHSALKQPL